MPRLTEKMRQLLKGRNITCPECKGTGKPRGYSVFDYLFFDWFFGVPSCELCDGLKQVPERTSALPPPPPPRKCCSCCKY